MSMSKPSIWPDSGLREPMSSVSAETPTTQRAARPDRLHVAPPARAASGAYDVGARRRTSPRPARRGAAVGSAAVVRTCGAAVGARPRSPRAGRAAASAAARRASRRACAHRYSSTRFEMPRQARTAASRPATSISQPTRTASRPAPDSASCVCRGARPRGCADAARRERVERGRSAVAGAGADRERDRAVPVAAVVERPDLLVRRDPGVEQRRRAPGRRRAGAGAARPRRSARRTAPRTPAPDPRLMSVNDSCDLASLASE